VTATKSGESDLDGEPQVRLAELLEPHLKVVEAVAAGQGRTREDVVRIQI